MHLHPIVAWFLALLILVILGNTLPTRHALAGLLFAISQACLLSDMLPFPLPRKVEPLWGLALALATLVLVNLRAAPARPGVAPLDRIWLDFRNGYGAVWGLRVAERVNATAEANNWNVRLTWQGFTEGNKPATWQNPAKTAEVQRSFIALLRRFVSASWIERRLGGPSVGTESEQPN